MEGAPDDIRKCIACVQCNHDVLEERVPIRCSVNALTGREGEIEIKPANERKRVLVIGAGTGGMEAARVAALRGHHVTIWEQHREVEGQLNLAEIPPRKEDIRELRTYLKAQLEKLGVAIKLNMKATPRKIVNFKPDCVVVATGSTPRVPNIPGVKKTHVVTFKDVLLGKRVGKTIVVLGGGMVGAETAEFLAQRGCKVTIVEMLPDIVQDAFSSRRVLLRRAILEESIRVLINSRGQKITEEGLEVANQKGETTLIRADNVVLAVGSNPETRLFDALEGQRLVFKIGDCFEPRRIMHAVHEGFAVGCQV